jgi:hypothetical protein
MPLEVRSVRTISAMQPDQAAYNVQANCVGAAMTSESHSSWYRDGDGQGAGGRESGSAARALRWR